MLHFYIIRKYDIHSWDKKTANQKGLPGLLCLRKVWIFLWFVKLTKHDSFVFFMHRRHYSIKILVY